MAVKTCVVVSSMVTACSLISGFEETYRLHLQDRNSTLGIKTAGKDVNCKNKLRTASRFVFFISWHFPKHFLANLSHKKYATNSTYAYVR
jgi:hypothetical protein